MFAIEQLDLKVTVIDFIKKLNLRTKYQLITGNSKCIACGSGGWVLGFDGKYKAGTLVKYTNNIKNI